MIDIHMPLSGSNRGYSAWQYIERIVLMLIGGGRHIEELREIPSPSTVGEWLRRQGNNRS